MAEDRIVSGSAAERVVAVAPFERVITKAAGDRIGSVAANQAIVEFAAEDRVVAIATVDGDRQVGREVGGRHARQVDQVGTVASRHHDRRDVCGQEVVWVAEHRDPVRQNFQQSRRPGLNRDVVTRFKLDDQIGVVDQKRRDGQQATRLKRLGQLHGSRSIRTDTTAGLGEREARTK